MDWIGRLTKSKEKLEDMKYEEPKEYVCTFLDRDIFKRGENYVVDVDGDEMTSDSVYFLKERILKKLCYLNYNETPFLKSDMQFSCYSFKEKDEHYHHVFIFYEDLKIGEIYNGRDLYFEEYVDDEVREKVVDDLANYLVDLWEEFQEEQKRKKEKAREILNCK